MSIAAATAVLLEIREHIAFMTLARPQNGNSIDLRFGRDYLATARAIQAASVRAVVLSGQGRNFCFGGDLKSMGASGSDVHEYLTGLTADLHAGMALLARMDAPIIAAVNGTAAGAGLGLVLAADLVIAARSAKFVAAYTAVGLTPDAGCTFLLPRAVGKKRAMELFLTNRILDAEQALAWGVINQVVDDEKLMANAEALATRIASGPVGVFGAVKRLLADSEPGFEAQLAREATEIATRGGSAEGCEGIAAFLEKRAPTFR